ncbi:nicotinate-nucleotide pyrophosphorylase [Youngiibacter fragilis 232.1]|uniref:Nicotinate-nucleotide pyrophosphorylase n=1 Tax=Youngiibacter fragilis 232.1 TaxID=994573 RepID=V7I8N7_9CLOT|nr:nicotinate-nucleotide pyrophosphorylase [Youngiibacter fragilis 232.1]
MVYLDKNYIRMLGSIKDALKSVEELDNLVKVIQIKGKDKSVSEETIEAIEGGCNLLMVDTGNTADLDECLRTLEHTGKGGEVKVAFSGGIKIVDIPELCRYKIEALCIGKEIVDALLLDMKLDVSADMKGE